MTSHLSALLAVLLSATATATETPPAAAAPETQLDAPRDAAPAPTMRQLLATRPASDAAHIGDEAIQAAVREALPGRSTSAYRADVDTLRGNRYSVFDAAFDDALVPDCLHTDGLKRQPTGIFIGLLALPFVAVAKLRGVCN